MSEERPTVRPVTLSRLVELTHVCDGEKRSTADIEATLEITHRRARETILEGVRIDLVEEHADDEETTYLTSNIGNGFLDAVKNEAWASVSSILATRSPHYGAFLDAVEKAQDTDLDGLLTFLEDAAEFTPYSYNETSLDVLGDWAERLGAVQRNAFTGDYYHVTAETTPANFPYVLLAVYDDLEETAGINLRQRHLSIPKLREFTCQRLGCQRELFDEALLALVSQNIGKVELSGAPLDTAAKDSPRGIRQIHLSEGDSLVSTSQTSDRVMAGVEHFGKKHYYFAVYDRDLTFTQTENTA